MMQEIETLLDTLAKLADDLSEQRAYIEALPEIYIPAEQLYDYVAVLEKYEYNIAAIQADTVAVREILKEAVIESGESHKRNGISAVLVSGRVKWNTKKLGNAVRMHPWLADFRSEGKPYVQIKGV